MTSLNQKTVLNLAGYGAWHGGDPIDNSIFENRGMFFKNNQPVTPESIEKRIGVRSRMAALPNEQIGVAAMKDLLDTTGLDPGRVKVIIGATNIGESKTDPGPLIRYPYDLIREKCPDALAFDLYAGCPGFNVSAELVLMLSLTGALQPGDLSVIVGAENLHRAEVFRPKDTSHIIFGDDAMAASMETQGGMPSEGRYDDSERSRVALDESDFVDGLAREILKLNGGRKIDGFIIDNQLGRVEYRIPATAPRVQHALVKRMFPEEAAAGKFDHFRDALGFYDDRINSFAYDVMSLNRDPRVVRTLARSYIEAGRRRSVVSVYLEPDFKARITIHRGEGFSYPVPQYGIVDGLTRTHGVFADYIQFVERSDGQFGEIDGKGVFQLATRGAKAHLKQLLTRHELTLHDLDMLIEHQANFAMIPLTLAQVLPGNKRDMKQIVADYIADKMVMNIHFRGNCSVVCMLRLAYDLQRGALAEDVIQGFAVNKNTDVLRQARLILYDSVGAGMTRSSLLVRKP